VYVPSPLPRWSCWVLIAPFPSSGSFPCEVVRSASTLLFSRPAQRLLTLQPAHSPNRLTILSIEGFRRLVALPPAPIATGWSDPCREGFAPSQELCLPRHTTSSSLRPRLTYQYTQLSISPAPASSSRPPTSLAGSNRHPGENARQRALLSHIWTRRHRESQHVREHVRFVPTDRSGMVANPAKTCSSPRNKRPAGHVL